MAPPLSSYHTTKSCWTNMWYAPWDSIYLHIVLLFPLTSSYTRVSYMHLFYSAEICWIHIPCLHRVYSAWARIQRVASRRGQPINSPIQMERLPTLHLVCIWQIFYIFWLAMCVSIKRVKMLRREAEFIIADTYRQVRIRCHTRGMLVSGVVL